MATPPIDPATQARLDALQAQVDKLTANNRTNSRSSMDATADFIKNDKISAKITAALDLLPTSITSSTVFKTSVGAITDAARLVGAIADQAVESADAVFNMYQSGVAIGMDQLSKTANDFGTTIDGLTKLLTKHGRVVSAMGIDATAQLGRQFLALTHNGTDLGMSIDEANEAALAYAEVVNNSGKMQRYNSTLLADGAKNFSKALNDAAQASGRNVEQIRAETVSRLGQADAFYLQQSMTDAESAMFHTNMANMESFNSSINNTGAQLQDWMVQFQSTGDISGIQDRAFTRALAATGTTDLFTKAMNQTGQEQKDTLAQIGGIMAQYAGENRALAGSRNPETQAMMRIVGNFGRDVNATTVRAGKGVDTTAAGIEGTMSEFQKAAAAVNNAINDLAVTGFVKFKEALAAGTEAAGEFAGIVSRFGQSMLPSEGTIDTTPPGDIPATIDSYLNQLIPTQLQGLDGGGSDAERRAATLVGPGGSAQDFLNNNQSLFGSQNPDTQEILRIIAAQARTETVSATLSPAAAFNQSGNDIAGGIATSFETNPAAGARIGSSIGMGILSYLNFDNIRAAIFGATPVTNNINTPNTNRQPDTDEIRMSAEIVSVAQQAQADRSEIQRQNMNMNTQLELMLSQLGMLNTNITDQTVALKNALGRSSNNVYT